MQKKKGISLIVLVITIIVMIILAAAIILTLNNSGIINRANEAVEKTDLAQIKNLAALKWSEAYLNNEEDIAEYILEGLKNEKINTDKYDITVTLNGVDVELKEEVPSEWIENVVAMKDGVPIPKGFVASPYNGERTKNSGLVIYELDEGEAAIPSNETQYTSWTTRNQYVWVPVPKEDFTKNFVRQNFGLDRAISNTLGEIMGFWEVELDLMTNMPLATQNSSYVTNITGEGGITNTLAEVQAMYASVREYEGFYIARYEAGIDSTRTYEGYKDANGNIILENNVYSIMGKIPYTNIPWTKNFAINEDTNGAVQAARGIYPVTDTEYGVVSTLTYGVQWDTVLKWWLDTNAVSSVTASTDYGNYMDHVIESEDLNDGAQVAVYNASNNTLSSYMAKESTALTYPKSSGTMWALSTGALKVASVKNIYDMAGNVCEWTMEGVTLDMDGRIPRGGESFANGTTGNAPVSSYLYFTPDNYYYNCGFRPSLYIKK